MGRLLLVEDDDALRDIVARHLEREGFAVEAVSSAEAAIDALEAGRRPGLIILDLGLPGASGWDLLRHPDLANAGGPPVIVTTATRVSPTRLAEIHVDAYLPKPFHLDELVHAIDRLVGARSASRP